MSSEPADTSPPVFDPEAPHHQKPKIRAVRAFPAKHGEQVVLGLADVQQITDRVVFTTPLAQFVLGQMTGQNSLEEIASLGATQASSTQGVPAEAVKALTVDNMQLLVAQLDNAGLLEGPTFSQMLAEMREEFDASEILPPGSTVQFAEMLVAQDKGEDVTDEQKRELAPEMLRKSLDDFIKKALQPASDPSFDTLPKAVIVPHLDYSRGWLNYAHVYGRMRVVDRPDRVIVLGTNHFGSGTGVVACNKGYETPLGTCQFDQAFFDLLASKLGEEDSAAILEHRYDHEREHSIELHIPWIQHVFGDAETDASPSVVGILVHDPIRNSGASYDGKGLALDPFVEALKATVDESPGTTLIVASADLSHVGKSFGDNQPVAGDTDEAKNFRSQVFQRDREMLKLIEEAKVDEFITAMAWQQNPTRWCSIGNLVATLRVTGAEQVKMINYAAAGDQQGMSLVSSCAAAIF